MFTDPKMSLELVSEWIRTYWPSIVAVSVATVTIAMLILWQNRAKDPEDNEDSTEEEDLEAVMKYWGPEVTSMSYEVKSVVVTRDTPNSSPEDTKHPTPEGIRSSQSSSGDQSAKEPAEKDNENVPQTDLKNVKEPMKEDGDHPSSPAEDKDDSKGRPSSDKDIPSDRPSSSEKTTPLKCDHENVLKAKTGELYQDENCKWRVLQRKNVEVNFPNKNN